MRKVTIDLDDIFDEYDGHISICKYGIENAIRKAVCRDSAYDILTDFEISLLFCNNYKEYLQSDVWRIRREKCFEHYGHQCYICGSSKDLQAHHCNYKNIFNESYNELECLCRDCHFLLHTVKDAFDAKEGDKNIDLATSLFFKYYDPTQVIPGHFPHISRILSETLGIVWNNGIVKALADKRKELLKRWYAKKNRSDN